jgi:hypothetical protein
LENLEAELPAPRAYEAFCREVKENEAVPGRPGPYDSKLHHYVLIKNNEAVVNRYHEQKENPDYEVELHTIRIGDIAFVTNPFELFLDYGHQIKARSPARQTFVVQLCCGRGGYLPTKKAEQHGGYGALVSNGNVGSEGGKMLVDHFISELHEMFGT